MDKSEKIKYFLLFAFFIITIVIKYILKEQKTMSENKARKVKEIFSDYQARANII